jgi:hypothetical protein
MKFQTTTPHAETEQGKKWAGQDELKVSICSVTAICVQGWT